MFQIKQTTALVFWAAVGLVVAPPRQVAAAEPVTFKSKLKNVSCAALSPDGKTLALGGESDTVEEWNVVTGKRRAIITQHPREVRCLAFGPDGKTLAVGCYRQVRLWDVKQGKELLTLKGHTTYVERVQFSPDGKRLFTASREEAKFWQLPAGDELAMVKSNAARWVLSPNGLSLLSYNFYWNNVDVRDAVKQVNRTPFRSGWTGCVASSADGRLAASGSKDTLLVWDAVTGKRLGSHDLHTDRLVSLDFSPDGKTVVSGSKDRTAILWDLTAKKERACLKGHSGEVVVKFSRDGQTVYTGSAGGSTVKAWDAATGKERCSFAANPSGVKFFVTAPDGNVLAVVCRDGTTKVWNVARVLAAAR